MRAGKSPAKSAVKEPPQARSNSLRWLWIALLAVTLAAYINSFQLGVALDGHSNLADRRTHAATMENVRLIFTKDYWWPDSQDQLYRPITKLSFLFNHAVLGNGNNPGGYHALNFALHAANVALVFALALRLLGMAWPAFFAASLWAVHPIGVDAVSNLAGRADLLAAFGLLGALLLYTRLCDGRGQPLRTAVAIFALAFLAVG